jgi:large subunit ribosomal protein L15
MQIHNVQPIHKNKPVMLVGRGGKRGKTSGRGTKGQNARAGHKNRPEMRDFIKRIPKLRGRGVSPFKSFAIKPWEVSLSLIQASFKAGDSVTPKTLIEKKLVGMVSGKIPAIKILAGKGGAGKSRVGKGASEKSEVISKKFAFSGVIVSAGAKTAIEKAGGSVTL